MEVLVGPLSQRLAKCIRGAHFQVAERTLALWGTDRFKRLMVDAAGSRAAAARHLLPALLASATAHWHENIRRCSQVVLEQYEELEPAAVQALREEADEGSDEGEEEGAGGNAEAGAGEEEEMEEEQEEEEEEEEEEEQDRGGRQWESKEAGDGEGKEGSERGSGNAPRRR